MKKIAAIVIMLSMILTLLGPASMVSAASEPKEIKIEGASVAATVDKLNGNQNKLTITANDESGSFSESYAIANNAAGTYAISTESGSYLVYVDTKGNTQVRSCYIVSFTPFHDPPVFDAAASFVGSYSITYSESGYNDVVEYDAYQSSYVKNPESGEAAFQTLNIMVPTSIRTVSYDASDSPVLFVNGSDGFDAAGAPAPAAGEFAFSSDFARRALWEGWVIIEAGNRGGVEGLADLKTALRFLRFDTNINDIPGNKDLIFALGGDYALLLGATANDAAYKDLLNKNQAAKTNDSVFAAAAYEPSLDQEYAALSSAMFDNYVLPSGLRQVQKEFATGGYAAAAAYGNLPASSTVMFNNGNNAASATNVISVAFSEADYKAWADSELPSSAAPDTLLEYSSANGDIAPNWWIRAGAANANANAAALKLAEDLKGKADLVNARVIWDGAVDVFGFFDFAHYILAQVFINPGTSTGSPSNGLPVDWYNFRPFIGLDGDNPWLPARSAEDPGQSIPGVTPTTSYPNYPLVTAAVPHTIRENIPYVAYESVPVPYKADTTYDSFGYYQRLDIYRADGTEDEVQPVIVYIHGGGGTGGDKRGPSNVWGSSYANQPAKYGSRDQMMARSGIAYGYTVVEINYRVNRSAANGGPVRVPGRSYTDAFAYPSIGTIDTRAAIRWLKDNAEMLGIDPDQIILAGASAGGALVDRAMLLGSNPAKYDTQNSQLAALGASQVNDNVAAAVSIMTTLGSGTMSEIGVHAYTPPYYFFAGERDATGNWRTNSLPIYNAVKAANPEAVVRLDVIEGGGHETATGSLANQYNIYTMYKWLADQGFSVEDPDVIHPLQGPENISFSFPFFYDNITTPVLTASEGINVATPVKAMNNTVGLQLTIGVTGTVAYDDIAYVAITNMDQILADAGIRPDQRFVIRLANPGNVDTRYTLESLSEINDYVIPLRNGTSTATISVYEGNSVANNARLTITISSSITIETAP